MEQLFSRIDKFLEGDERILIIIDGMAAAGKSTLAETLLKKYSCNLIHTDSFFLRAEQRLPERYNEPGGNIDYERFLSEVAEPLIEGKPFTYRPFDCSSMALAEPIRVNPEKITVVEGVYSMHPHFSHLWDCNDFTTVKVFLKINDKMQKDRLRARNPSLAERFLSEWIPMENNYFKHFDIPSKCDFIFSVGEQNHE